MEWDKCRNYFISDITICSNGCLKLFYEETDMSKYAHGVFLKLFWLIILKLL